MFEYVSAARRRSERAAAKITIIHELFRDPAPRTEELLRSLVREIVKLTLLACSRDAVFVVTWIFLVH